MIIVLLFEREKARKMRKKYLTISEFAALRDININSLRYYEKLKILIPAWIDPKTKYRYYLPEQLGTLDTILLCIRLDIPLKNLNEYIDENGNLNEKAILENGKKAMQEKISQMQKGIELTKFHLENMEQNQRYCGQTGVYTRRIEERFFIEAPFKGNWSDLDEKEKTAMSLFHDAQVQDMVPVFPAGILIHCDTSPVSYSFFVQVLHPRKQDQRVLHIPESDFQCVQLDVGPQTNILNVIKQNFDFKELKLALVTNMPLAKSSFNSRHSEIQIPVFY